jgi:hypothetical protein
LTKLLPLITEALLVCVLRNAFVPDIQLSKNTVTSRVATAYCNDKSKKSTPSRSLGPGNLACVALRAGGPEWS